MRNTIPSPSGSRIRYGSRESGSGLTAISSSTALSLPPRTPGVPPEALPHIFERFYRAGSQGTRGSGLGLAIAAEIAAAHGGTAEAARAFPRGLRIRLSLPGYASPRRIRTAAAPSNRSA